MKQKIVTYALPVCELCQKVALIGNCNGPLSTSLVEPIEMSKPSDWMQLGSQYICVNCWDQLKTMFMEESRPEEEKKEEIWVCKNGVEVVVIRDDKGRLSGHVYGHEDMRIIWNDRMRCVSYRDTLGGDHMDWDLVGPSYSPPVKKEEVKEELWKCRNGIRVAVYAPARETGYVLADKSKLIRWNENRDCTEISWEYQVDKGYLRDWDLMEWFEGSVKRVEDAPQAPRV